jgi:hypothetical protein
VRLRGNSTRGALIYLRSSAERRGARNRLADPPQRRPRPGAAARPGAGASRPPRPIAPPASPRKRPPPRHCDAQRGRGQELLERHHQAEHGGPGTVEAVRDEGERGLHAGAATGTQVHGHQTSKPNPADHDHAGTPSPVALGLLGLPRAAGIGMGRLPAQPSENLAQAAASILEPEVTPEACIDVSVQSSQN